MALYTLYYIQQYRTKRIVMYILLRFEKLRLQPTSRGLFQKLGTMYTGLCIVVAAWGVK